MQSLADEPKSALISELEGVTAIPGPAGNLEARFRICRKANSTRVAIICHPHPQHGGTMNNKVVTTLARTYDDLGWHSLRFNFRGVGHSQGSYGHLKGEIEDLQAVVAFVQEKLPGADIALAGFSFGSAVAANLAAGQQAFSHLLLVAPPIGKYDLDFPNSFACPTLVVQGLLDEIVDPDQNRRWAASAVGDMQYLELPQAGHFFHGQLTELAVAVTSNFHPRKPSP